MVLFKTPWSYGSFMASSASTPRLPQASLGNDHSTSKGDKKTKKIKKDKFNKLGYLKTTFS